MGEQSNILDTIKSKLVQANTDTTSDAGRESIRKDIAKLLTQLDNIATQTNYNGKSLLADVKDGKLTGKEAGALNFQIGASNSDIVSTSSINSTSAGLGGGNTAISEIKAGSTVNLKNAEGATTTVTGGAALDLNVSGNLGVVSGVAGTVTIKVTDAATIAKFDSLTKASGGLATATKGTGEYTLAAGASVDLSSVNIGDAKISTASANQGFRTTGATLKVINNDQVNNVDVGTELKVAQETVTVKAESKQNLTVATSGTALNINLSGNVGSLSTSGQALTLTTTNSTDIAALQKLVDDNVTGISRTDGDTFTITANTTVNLSGIDFNQINVQGSTFHYFALLCF
jgi:flagellin